MKVAIGSQNPVKLKAVKLAFEAVWPKKKWVVTGADVSSGVSFQPMSDLESIKGATTRAKKAMRQIKADFGVGIEGGLQKTGGRWFDCGWVVVIGKKGEVGIASSVKAHTPSKMMVMVKKGMELGDVDDILFEKKNSKQAEGHFGLITNNLVTRTQAYKDAVVMALSRYIHPALFD
ncbi:MAG TPA: inosine/xanthosine triphosphatase [Patescibacteria group bacterium]|nr:inosine/xanthosine triphosphatase [Patescibacteria group bacterium]